MVTLQGQDVDRVVMTGGAHKDLLDHCLRKLEERYQEGETPEPKAYGLIGGTVENGTLTVSQIAPLRRNARLTEPHRSFMDDILNRYAVASVTPLERRGWVADPRESRRILTDFDQQQLELVGTYHMHRVSWKGDSLRDMPTELDTVLAEDTDLLMFIISVVDPSSPIVRAFYEGDCAAEIPLTA
ncbi:MAG: hypothetical protein P8011_08490 [Acidihalobacter sp.]|uniref:hypothetical protein n=1 Tax=Acidihalobacter sp. TaxID=1872108 RepID=UPI00307F759F